MDKEKRAFNLELWEKYQETDPNHTKKVTQRGGFTAIDAQYQLKQATAEWGPYGAEWGVRDVTYGYVKDIDRQTGSEVLVEIYIEGTFFYPGGSFPISSDQAYKAGQDCRKKLLTDITTKALSKLGFNADVFMGLYDDNKYIKDLKEKYGAESEDGKGEPPPTKPVYQKPAQQPKPMYQKPVTQPPRTSAPEERENPYEQLMQPKNLLTAARKNLQ